MTHSRTIAALLALFACVLFGPTLLAQAAQQIAGAATGGPLASTGAQETSEWGNAAVWAFLSTSALEWIKRKPWFALIGPKSAWWSQRILGIAVAAVTAVGIHYSFEWGAVPGEVTVHVTGLTWASIIGAGGETLRQFVFNEVIYRTAVKDYGK